MFKKNHGVKHLGEEGVVFLLVFSDVKRHDMKTKMHLTFF